MARHHFFFPLIRTAGIAVALILLAGCDGGDPVNLQGRPAPGRAVANPFYTSAANDEVFSRNSGTMTLVTVDFANDKNSSSEVHTVVDDIATITGKAPATQAATQPATRPAVEVATAAGTDEIKIAAQQNADGVVVTRDNEANADLWITSARDTGSVTLQRTGEGWPAIVRVHLSYEKDKPVTHLEDLTAAEVTGEHQVTLKTSVDKDAGKGQVLIPGFSRAPQVLIRWMGATR